MKKYVFFQLVFLSFSLFAQYPKTSSGAEFLNYLNSNLGAMFFSPDKLPNNLGGKLPKYVSDNDQTFLKLNSDIAISDEAIFQDVIKDIFEPLDKMILAQKMLTDTMVNSKDNKTKVNFNFDYKNKSTPVALDDILQFEWVISKIRTMSNKNFDENFNDYLSQFKTVEYVEVSPYSMKSAISDREPKTFKPFAYEVLSYVDIRGLDKGGHRRNDRFTFTSNVYKDSKTLNWKLGAFNLMSGETLTIERPYFSEVKEIAQKPPSNYLRREAIRRGGYALSVSDWNQDGIPDLIVGHLGGVEFFKGTGHGDFINVDPETLGVQKDTLVKSIVCEDFDHDGIKDLLFVRFVPRGEDKDSKDIILYKGVSAGKFVQSTSIKKRLRSLAAMPAAVGDFNNDGLLDFYVGFPGAKDFTVLDKNIGGFSGKKVNHPQGLFFNLGKFIFEDVTNISNIGVNVKNGETTSKYPEAALIFPHTSMAVDYDLDGKMDIVVVDDKANLSPLYKNDGDGKFTQVAEKIGVTNYDFGMGFAAADLDNSGSLQFLYTNVNFLATERMNNSMMANFSKYSNLPGNSGLRLFKTTDNKTYSDITAISGLSHPGYGVGGVETIDFNNDGYSDIYVANGLWSGNTKTQDVSSLFSRSYLKHNLDFATTFDASVIGVKEANSSFMKILTDFSGDISTGKKDASVKPSMTGFQRNRLYRNNKNGTFTEIGYLAGVDSIADGYIVAVADLNSDGKMDLILRNADPGTEENKFPSVQVYLNQMETKNKSVVLTFKGQKSNTSGIGMIAVANIQGKKLTRHLIANNGASQSQNILHFGLGEKEDQIDTLTLKWPSGVVNTYKNVSAGYHQYTESVK